jgi:excisionase family DNA binding protein
MKVAVVNRRKPEEPTTPSAPENAPRSRPRRPPIDVDSAALYLGTTPRHIRRLIADKRLSSVKVGGKTRLLPDTLDAFLAAHTVHAREVCQ